MAQKWTVWGAIALTLAGLAPATAAWAQDRDDYGYRDRDEGYRAGYARGGRNEGGWNGGGWGRPAWRGRDYDDARYSAPHGFEDRGYPVYSGYSGYQAYRYQPVRYRCGTGTTGLILGGVIGSLLGRSVAGDYGDRTAGAIIGGGAGALAGRAIERSDDRCRR